MTIVTGGETFCVEFVFFFFQAEDGIRDLTVTGVQTCALPISVSSNVEFPDGNPSGPVRAENCPRMPESAASCTESSRAGASTASDSYNGSQIGRASCRERV